MAPPRRGPWPLRPTRSTTDSPGVPREVATTSRRPDPASAAPSSAGPASGEVSTATLGWARHAAATGPSGRPWAETTTASSHDRPARPNAAATDDTAGTTRGVSPRSRSSRTMPKNPGSPLASTTASPECAAISSSAADTSPITTTLAAKGMSTESRWRPAPTTRVADASASAAGGLPSRPMTVSVMP